MTKEKHKLDTFTDVLRFALVVCVNATRAKDVWSGCSLQIKSKDYRFVSRPLNRQSSYKVHIQRRQLWRLTYV